MAEFALGLTKTAVEGTVSRVKSAIEEEAKLKVRVQNDLVFISGEFQMMQSFLNVANVERAENKVVRTWVRQVRDLAFDVEDCIELVVGLDIKSGRSWLWRVVPGCMAPPRLLDQAVATIQQLKARVEDVSQRNTRYSLISDTGSTSNTSHHIPVAEHTIRASAFHILHEVWEEAGKHRGMGDLSKYLMSNQGSHLEVISLWGGPAAADHGATHVISEAYNNPQIRQEFNIRFWVKIIHPFNPDKFVKSFITQFYTATASHHLRPTMEDYHLIKSSELMEQVGEHKYLLILENIATVAEWDVIKMYLPGTNKGSRVVMSTQHLGLALSCTGKPYQVSELRHFSHGQPLYAFFTKVPGRSSELCRQLRRGGVISVWGSSKSTTLLDSEPVDLSRTVSTTLLDSVYTSITLKGFAVDGVEFDKHVWVDIPRQCNLRSLCSRLLMCLYAEDFEAEGVSSAVLSGDTQVVADRCLKFMREHKCLVVMNGLREGTEWEWIRKTFLAETSKACILVIVHPSAIDAAALARHCVDHEEDGALNFQELESDTVLRHSIKSCEYYGIGAKEASWRGRFFSNRMEEARIWTKKFGHVVRKDQANGLGKLLSDPGVISVWGTAGAGKSPFVRRIYYDQLVTSRRDDNIINDPNEFGDLGFTSFSWVDVPHPFDLTELCFRLITDSYSDNLNSKVVAAFHAMESQDDSIRKCGELVRQNRCFVVINGLGSKDDWNAIRDAFLLSEPSKSCIVVVTNDETVAMHCVDNISRVLSVKGLEADGVLRPLIKDCGYYGNAHGEASRFFSNRREETRKWANTFELVGHQHQGVAVILASQISEEAHVGVLSVWGMAGVGKSAIVRMIYSNCMLGSEELRFTYFSWVDVPHPFNLTEFCWRLLVDIHSDDHEAKEDVIIAMFDGAKDPIQECRKFLQKECFLVIDGLRSTHDWDLIRDALLPDTTKVCIIVIANESNVATHCVTDEIRVVNVRSLEPEVALHLFTKVAMGGKELSDREIQVLNITMAKCGRLPKVIAAISEEYRTCGQNIGFLEYLNDDFMGILETRPEFHCLNGIFSWMRSYFDDCSDAVKPCIFYLSIFLADQNIRHKRLLRRWIAEGYCRDKFGVSTEGLREYGYNTWGYSSDKSLIGKEGYSRDKFGINAKGDKFGISAEEDGKMLFNELTKLSIIQVPPNQFSGRVIANNMFQVNGFFHGYIMSRQMEDNLVFVLEGRCSLNLQRAGQHLTIRASWDRDEIVFRSMDLSRVRSLTVFGAWRSFFVCKDINMGLLRVLDLEDTSGITDSDLEKIAKLLPRLKFLSLRGCREITRVPKSLGSLRQLQTLDVKNTSVVELPASITELQKLQYIRAGTSREKLDQSHSPQPTEEATNHDGTSTSQTSLVVAEPTASTTLAQWRRKARDFAILLSKKKKLSECQRHDDNGFGIKVPTTGIWNMAALHTFGVVNVSGTGGKAILKEVKKLTQLRKLGVSCIDRENWHDLCSTISGHGYLESLSVHLDKGEPAANLFSCSDDNLPKSLKSFKLYTADGEVVQVGPSLVKHLHGLRKVHLELTVSTQEDIYNIMEFPHQRAFRNIYVKPNKDGQLHYGQRETKYCDAFTRAPILKIDCGNYKLTIVFGFWVATYVEVLVVQCSSTESSLELYGLEELQRLEEVWLKGSYSEAVKQHLQQKVDEHKNNTSFRVVGIFINRSSTSI